MKMPRTFANRPQQQNTFDAAIGLASAAATAIRQLQPTTTNDCDCGPPGSREAKIAADAKALRRHAAPTRDDGQAVKRHVASFAAGHSAEVDSDSGELRVYNLCNDDGSPATVEDGGPTGAVGSSTATGATTQDRTRVRARDVTTARPEPGRLKTLADVNRNNAEHYKNK
jgi:hypothetical protein